MWEPFGTVPANATAFWRSGPDERGTLSILSSCIITLLLCAYTSIHLDIASHGKASWKHQSWRRALWVLVGLLAPEGIAFIAFRQWSLARTLEFQMKHILGDLDPGANASARAGDVERDLLMNNDARITSLDPAKQGQTEGSRRKYPWTRIHSHFALMGGFVVDMGPLSPAVHGHSLARRTLTPVALRTIAKNCPSCLPDISAEFIRDKSKANSFAKLLVCVQACWFIAQTVGRLATRLPISLLEMNTLLHAICCLCIYLAWWYKPLDIEEPHLINTSDQYVEKVLAWMIVKDAQYIRHDAYMDDSKGYPEKVSSFAFCVSYEDDIGSGDDCVITEHARERLIKSKETARICNLREELVEPDYNYQWIKKRENEAARLKLYPGQRLHGFVVTNWMAGAKDAVQSKLYATFSLDHVNLLKLAHSLHHGSETGQVWAFGNQFVSRRSEGKMLTQGTSMAYSPDKGLEKWRRSTFLSPDTVLWASVLIAGSLYGGLHLIAWNGPFTTNVQRLLWRISCFLIISPLVFVLIMIVGVMIFANLIEPCLRSWDWLRMIRRWDDSLDDFAGYSLMGLMVIFGIFYAAARLYLVVECFINIAYLPDDVFQEPRWSRYIPHFGAG